MASSGSRRPKGNRTDVSAAWPRPRQCQLEAALIRTQIQARRVRLVSRGIQHGLRRLATCTTSAWPVPAAAGIERQIESTATESIRCAPRSSRHPGPRRCSAGVAPGEYWSGLNLGILHQKTGEGRAHVRDIWEPFSNTQAAAQRQQTRLVRCWRRPRHARISGRRAPDHSLAERATRQRDGMRETARRQEPESRSLPRPPRSIVRATAGSFVGLPLRWQPRIHLILRRCWQ